MLHPHSSNWKLIQVEKISKVLKNNVARRVHFPEDGQLRMGIERFTKHIRSLISGTHHRFVTRDQNFARQRILVDGIGLIFAIFSNTKRTDWSGIFADYKRFSEELIRWCDDFQRLGVNLEFYFDSTDNAEGSQESRGRKDELISPDIRLQDHHNGLAVVNFVPNLVVAEAVVSFT